MSFERISANLSRSNARITLRIVQPRSHKSPALRIYIGHDTAQAAGFVPSSYLVVLWGSGEDLGKIAIVPDPQGVKALQPGRTDGAAIAIVSHRLPAKPMKDAGGGNWWLKLQKTDSCVPSSIEVEPGKLVLGLPPEWWSDKPPANAAAPQTPAKPVSAARAINAGWNALHALPETERKRLIAMNDVEALQLTPDQKAAREALKRRGVLS